MNHRPFEDWLLDDETLSPQQTRELQAHVRDCASCASIAESNLALHSTRLVSPAPGFAERFGVRLEKRRREQRWRQVIGTIVLVLGGVALVAWLAGPFIVDAFTSPATWITVGVGYFLFIMTSLQALGEVSIILLRVIPSFIPPVGWIILTMGAAGLGYLWTISIRRVARVPQGA